MSSLDQNLLPGPVEVADVAAPARRIGNVATLLSMIREDYRRHGRSLANAAIPALAVYRYGCWALDLPPGLGRRIACKSYGLAAAFIGNVTKIWIPAQVVVGRDFHVIHAEGSLSIHPDVVIGDRLGVMHNVTLGTNMGPGTPTLGDDIFIGVNATILGQVTIGDRVRIAANSAVTTDVPADSIVIGSPARIFPRLGPFVDGKGRATP